MSEMVERAAWAVCPILKAVDECDMPEIINGPRPECRQCVPLDTGVPGCLLVACLVARAAIAAMREPTEAMLNAGLLHGFKNEDGLSAYPYRLWHAMIDAALED